MLSANYFLRGACGFFCNFGATSESLRAFPKFPLMRIARTGSNLLAAVNFTVVSHLAFQALFGSKKELSNFVLIGVAALSLTPLLARKIVRIAGFQEKSDLTEKKIYQCLSVINFVALLVLLRFDFSKACLGAIALEGLNLVYSFCENFVRYPKQSIEERVNGTIQRAKEFLATSEAAQEKIDFKSISDRLTDFNARYITGFTLATESPLWHSQLSEILFVGENPEFLPYLLLVAHEKHIKEVLTVYYSLSDLSLSERQDLTLQISKEQHSPLCRELMGKIDNLVGSYTYSSILASKDTWSQEDFKMLRLHRLFGTPTKIIFNPPSNKKSNKP